MKIALIGCGRIGRVHAESVALHPKAELVRVCDPMEAAAREVAERFGGLPGADVDSVLADFTVDAVVIASPTPTHLDLLARAVEAGKAVLCEKPIDLDLARVDDCRARVAGAESRIMVGFNRRFDPSFRAVHERVAAGEVGRPEHLTIVSRDPAPSPANYLAGSGGLLRDMTIHDFDMARFFLGEVVEVSAMGSNLVADYITQLGDIDGAVVTLRAASGALCHITNSRRCTFGYDQRLEVFGSLGMLAVDNLHPDAVRSFTAHGIECASTYLDFFAGRYTSAYRSEFDHFVKAIGNGWAAEPGFDDGRAALALATAAEESLHTGRAVQVGPTTTPSRAATAEGVLR